MILDRIIDTAVFGMRMLKRTLNFFYVRKSIFFEIYHLYVCKGINRKISLSKEEEKFAHLNRKVWGESKNDKRPCYVLVEGFLAGSGPNYLMRTGISAKAIESKTQCVPVVLLNDYAYETYKEKLLYSSFGISNYIYLRRHEMNIVNRIKSYIFAFFYLLKDRDVPSLLKLEFRGLYIGDLIYDDILHSTGVRTIDKVGFKFIQHYYAAFLTIYTYEKIFKKYHVKYAVLTHTCYVMFGVLARMAYLKGVKIYESSDIHTAEYYKEPSDEYVCYPYFHEGVRDFIQDEMPDISGDKSTAGRVDEHLESRMLGRIDQIDVRLAYCGKKVYDKKMLREDLGMENSYKTAFIFAHIFVDSPHLSKHMLYPDYYVWLRETMHIISGIGGINWIVKPHPAASVYKEAGEVELMVRESQRRNVNIHLCPDNFNTYSIKSTADAIVTAQGTVGIEFSCYGIPAIIVGAPFYRGFGFTVEPSDVEEYERELKNIKNVKRLSPPQIATAKNVYEGFRRNTSSMQSKMISMDLLNKVWGYETDRDIEGAYKLLNNNLADQDPRDHFLYGRVEKSFE